MKDITKALKANIRVENMTSNAGNDVPNQFIIYTEYGKMFRSYSSNIAFIPYDENTIYLGSDWEYSRTTTKYRNEFLRCNTAELRTMIKNGRAVINEGL